MEGLEITPDGGIKFERKFSHEKNKKNDRELSSASQASEGTVNSDAPKIICSECGEQIKDNIIKHYLFHHKATWQSLNRDLAICDACGQIMTANCNNGNCEVQNG